MLSLRVASLSTSDLLVLVGAALACGYACIQVARALLASRWPTVEGEIAGTRLVRRYDGDAQSADYDYVAYRYQVNGQPYRNDRVRFGPQVTPQSVVPALDPEPNSPRDTAALAARYPRGKPVRVYYNPRRPEESVLYPMPNLTVWVILAAGVMGAAAALHLRF